MMLPAISKHHYVQVHGYITIQVQYGEQKVWLFSFLAGADSGHSLVNENKSQKTRVVNNRRF